MEIRLNIKTKFYMQLILGLVFGFLNYGAKMLQGFNPIPLYMDTLFTVTASFFGLFCGLVSGTIYHLTSLFLMHQTVENFTWVLCSYTLVLIIRLYTRRKEVLSLVDVVILFFMAALIISFEGAIIFVSLKTLANYREDSQVRNMYLMLSRGNIPVFVSALLPRVPMNLLDKAISVSLGALLYGVFQKNCPYMKKACEPKQTNEEA